MAETIKRKQIPKGDIFDFWKDKCITKDGLVIPENYKQDTVPVVCDWGEVTCWACGRYYGCIENEKSLKALWNSDKAKSLQKCHIIPFSLDNKNEKESNLFLMCKRCHKESPDTKNPRNFFKWLYKKRTSSPILVELAVKCLKELKDDYGITEPNIDAERAFRKENFSTQAGEVSDSTMYYLLLEDAITHSIV